MVLYAGAAVYGFFFASCVVLVPILVRQLFGQREYPEIYSRVSMFVNIVGAIGAPFWALFGKNYPMLFTVAIVLLVVVLLLGIFCFGKMKGLQEAAHLLRDTGFGKARCLRKSRPVWGGFFSVWSPIRSFG